MLLNSAAQGVVLKGITDTLNTDVDSLTTSIDSVISAINTIDAEIITLSGYLNQAVKTTSSPTFAGITVNGNITISGTVDGRDVSVDGGNLDTLVSRVNQAVLTTSSPTFAGATINGLSWASTINQDVRTTASPTFAGATIAGATWTATVARITTLEGRVNQDVRTTASPTFVGLTLSGNTVASASVPAGEIGCRSTNTSATGYSIMRLGNDTVNQCVWFLNGSSRATDGGGNASTIRNDAGPMIVSSPAQVRFDVNSLSRFNMGGATTDINAGASSIPIIAYGELRIQNNLNLSAATNSVKTTIGGISGTDIITATSAGGPVYNYLVLGSNGMAVTGGLSWNTSTGLPRVHNGSSWSDLVTSASIPITGKYVGGCDYTYVKDSTTGAVAEACYNQSGVVSTAFMGALGRIYINVTYTGTMDGIVTVTGRSPGLPNYNFNIYRSTGTQFVVSATGNCPVYSDPTNIYSAMVDLAANTTNGNGIGLRISFFAR